jgi:hypothetical protein
LLLYKPQNEAAKLSVFLSVVKTQLNLLLQPALKNAVNLIVATLSQQYIAPRKNEILS